MTEIWQFLLLGVALAPAYTLLGQSTVLVFRGSNVVNFAVGTYALIGASVFYACSNAGIPLVLGLVLGLLAGGIIGAATYLLVIRNLRGASQLVKVVATLGVQIVILEALALHFKDSVLFPPTLLPNHQWHILGATVGSYDLCLFGVTTLLTAGLWAFYRYSMFGLQTSAVAENTRAAAALGRSPETIGLANWMLGGVLAAFAGIVITPTLGLSVGGVSLLLVPALAVALLASFRNFWLVVLGGLVVGIGESELTHFLSRYSWGFGWPQSFPFVLIVIVLVVRGTALPDRSFIATRLPAIGTGKAPRALIVGAVLVAVLGLVFLSGAGAAALGVSLAGGIVLLSIVTVTGYAGQVSLAQVAIGGLGAFIAAKLGHALDLSFWLSMIVGIVAILPIGALIGLPALRARGVNLAIVTLGLAMVIDTVILGNTTYTGGFVGLPIHPAALFGFSLDNTAHPNRYAAMCLVFFVIAAWIVSNLRRGRVGRHLIAVRSNERAAVALGLNLTTVKLYAFVVASGLAALGGILLAFQSDTVLFSSVTPTDSITYLSFIVIAGLGYVSGAPFAAMLLAGGFFSWVLGTIFTSASTATYIALAGGLGTVLILLADPDGLTSLNIKTAKADFGQLPRWAYLRPEVIVLVTFGLLRRRFARPVPEGHRTATSPLAVVAVKRVEPGTLVLEEVTVRFGGVTALSEVSLRVDPGEIVALIGPNGAGKTTLVDAVTGMTPRYSGRILLNEKPLEGQNATERARAGIGRSFQSLELFEDLSVEDNLRAASDRPQAYHYLTDLVLPRTPALPAPVVAAIDEFGLRADLARKPSDLAFGRRRLVGIARAVANMPRVLLLDEPASGLDENESEELATLLRKLADEWGFAILLIEHDMSVVLSISDRVVALDFGKKIAEGTAQEIRSDPAVIGAYLGIEGDPPSDQRELETML